FSLPGAPIAGAQSVPELESEMRRRNSWIVVDEHGARHYGYDGAIAVAAAAHGDAPVRRAVVSVRGRAPPNELRAALRRIEPGRRIQKIAERRRCPRAYFYRLRVPHQSR